MKVLSLFDGISCGMLALKRAGIKVDRYVAYEIDKYAIEISKKNYPQIEHCGDVTKADFTQYKDFDLVIGGSPCQGFSFAGKQLNFNDDRSKLYFEFERAIKEINPKYFLLENVKMKKEFSDIITKRLGVQPIEINSNLLSAQNRKRLYWTNIPNITLPKDKNIKLKDIIHENEKNCTINLESYKIPYDKAIKILDKEVCEGKIKCLGKDDQVNRAYSIHGKTVKLYDDVAKEEYLFGCLTPDRENKRQCGQRFNTGEKFYTLTALDRHGILVNGYMRRLTPIEYERLQTLPDLYTAQGITIQQIPESQRYKCLGNGWTVSVIEFIFNFITKQND